jgi:hypothetical protein
LRVPAPGSGFWLVDDKVQYGEAYFFFNRSRKQIKEYLNTGDKE